MSQLSLLFSMSRLIKGRPCQSRKRLRASSLRLGRRARICQASQNFEADFQLNLELSVVTKSVAAVHTEHLELPVKPKELGPSTSESVCLRC